LGGLLVAGGGVWLLFGREGTPRGAEERRAQTVARQCTSCGHTDHFAMEELIGRGWMALEVSEGPVGEGRKCPRCGRMSMRFVGEAGPEKAARR